MGLDISAYSKVKRLESFKADEYGEPEGIESVNVCNSDYKERAGNIIHGYYTYEKEYGFRAGSYSGYNNWREQLSELAGYPLGEYGFGGQLMVSHSGGAWKSTGGAFWELIDFSDCEGVIGTEVCQKLLKDFKEYDDRAKSVGEYFYELYKEWTEAITIAADGGFIDFH